MNTATVRKMRKIDCARLAAMHRDCFADSWSEESFRNLMESPGVFGFLAKGLTATGWEAFALARAIAEEGEIFTLGTLPQARRTGLAGRLVRAVMQEAGRRGASRLILEVDDSNEAALHLYGQAGFSQIGRRYGYYVGSSGNVADALMLAVKLPRQ